MRKTVGVICIKVVIEWKGGDESAESGSVHDEKQETQNGTLGNTTGGGTQGRKSVITSDTEAAMWQVGLKPVEDRAMDTQPREETSE